MDLFCEAEKTLTNQIVFRTGNFLLLHDGYPLTRGHLFLIPKKHRSCFLELSPDEKKEFGGLKEKIIRFLTQNAGAPVLFEHGIIAQTIAHAHLHFLPTEKSIRKEIEDKAVPMDIPAAPYLFYEDREGPTYYRVIRGIAPGFLHTTFARLLGRPANGPDRAKEAKEWTLQIKQLWDHA